MIEDVGVLGCGIMGAGIAETLARSNLRVIVVEQADSALTTGYDRIAASLERAHRAGKLSEAESPLGNIQFSTDLGSVSTCQLIIEAIIEEEQAKLSLFRAVDKVVTTEDVILASNTSSIPIMKLATVTERPSQVVGLHFFNPVPVLPLVELVGSLLTDEQTLILASDFIENRLGKNVIHAKDRAGFIVNALLVPYILSAIRMLESGFATAKDIDDGMVLGCAHPMGPLALCDLIGLDTTAAVASSLYEEFKEPLYAAPPLLTRMVEAGLCGRKSGYGFYEYE